MLWKDVLKFSVGLMECIILFFVPKHEYLAHGTQFITFFSELMVLRFILFAHVM